VTSLQLGEVGEELDDGRSLAAGEPQDLGPEDLEVLAQSAWWVGQQDTASGAWERAYTLYARSGTRWPLPTRLPSWRSTSLELAFPRCSTGG